MVNIRLKKFLNIFKKTALSLSPSLNPSGRLIFHFLIVISLVLIPLGQGTKADGLNNIRYTEKMWDPRVLRILIEGPDYLNPDLEFTIDPPRANDSPFTQQELKTLQEYQKQNRTKLQVKEIKREATKGAFVDMFVESPEIPRHLAKVAYNILKLADKECQYFVVKYKKRFSRPRPSQLDPNLILVVENPGHAAYPSGHATQSMLSALILGLIDPKNSQTYIDYAHAMAKRREVAGVHYPSDSSQGQKLAKQVLHKLIKIPKFDQEISEALLKYNQ